VVVFLALVFQAVQVAVVPKAGRIQDDWMVRCQRDWRAYARVVPSPLPFLQTTVPSHDAVGFDQMDRAGIERSYKRSGKRQGQE